MTLITTAKGAIHRCLRLLIRMVGISIAVVFDGMADGMSFRHHFKSTTSLNRQVFTDPDDLKTYLRYKPQMCSTIKITIWEPSASGNCDSVLWNVVQNSEHRCMTTVSNLRPSRRKALQLLRGDIFRFHCWACLIQETAVKQGPASVCNNKQNCRCCVYRMQNSDKTNIPWSGFGVANQLWETFSSLWVTEYYFKIRVKTISKNKSNSVMFLPTKCIWPGH
jgi:hypothetical protein